MCRTGTFEISFESLFCNSSVCSSYDDAVTIFVELPFVNQSSLVIDLTVHVVDVAIEDCVVNVDLGSSGGFSDFECRDLDDSGGGSKLYV